LEEVKEIVKENLEVNLEEMAEYDRSDALSYFRERSSPSRYYKECLADYSAEGEPLEKIMSNI